jgi:hypothetical protein
MAKAAFYMVNFQVLLGISTLLYLVPVHLAACHQAGSVALLTTLVHVVVSLRRPGAAAKAWREAVQAGKALPIPVKKPDLPKGGEALKKPLVKPETKAQPAKGSSMLETARPLKKLQPPIKPQLAQKTMQLKEQPTKKTQPSKKIAQTLAAKQ